VVRGRAAER